MLGVTKQQNGGFYDILPILELIEVKKFCQRDGRVAEDERGQRFLLSIFFQLKSFIGCSF